MRTLIQRAVYWLGAIKWAWESPPTRRLAPLSAQLRAVELSPICHLHRSAGAHRPRPGECSDLVLKPKADNGVGTHAACFVSHHGDQCFRAAIPALT